MIAFMPASAADLRQRERRAMLAWTGVIVGLLLLGIGLSVGGALIALHGRPMVEEDYYNKALHWDDQEALLRASAALGWKADISVGADVTTAGDRALMLRLSDRAGKPLENAQVSVGFYHLAHPLDLTQVELKSVGNGLYAASVPLNHAGKWEFRLTIHRPSSADAAKDEMYVGTLQKDLLE